MGLADRLDQQAVVGFARHDRRAALAAFLQGIRRIEPQSAHPRVRVAGVTVGRQDRAHLALEELARVSARGHSGQQCGLTHKYNNSHGPLRPDATQWPPILLYLMRIAYGVGAYRRPEPCPRNFVRGGARSSKTSFITRRSIVSRTSQWSE